MRSTVTFGGVVLDCDYSYWPGYAGSMTEPPEPPLVEFNFVLHKGEDVWELLGEDKEQDLIELILQDIRDQKDEAMSGYREVADRVEEFDELEARNG